MMATLLGFALSPYDTQSKLLGCIEWEGGPAGVIVLHCDVSTCTKYSEFTSIDSLPRLEKQITSCSEK